VVQLTAKPTLPDAVLASDGITSERTTQVTGPKPIEKAQTKATIEAADNAAIELLIPMASVRAATLMTSVGKSSSGLDPTRYCQWRLIKGAYLDEECWHDGQGNLGHDDEQGNQARITVEYGFKDSSRKVHDR